MENLFFIRWLRGGTLGCGGGLQFGQLLHESDALSLECVFLTSVELILGFEFLHQRRVQILQGLDLVAQFEKHLGGMLSRGHSVAPKVTVQRLECKFKCLVTKSNLRVAGNTALNWSV
jgi:hypothetical protein